ncbi:MAG: hypothetical protein IPK85_14645 [Gemmatimonadetes bacterium]|nr:hypothetical protein [Gemmatimonadota bacterium]
MTNVRVYFNGRGVDAPGGATVLDALAVFDSTMATEVREGQRALVDSRGLAADPSAAAYAGAIFRVVSARAASGGTA